MTEFDDLFNTFLFGTGAWFGFLVLVLIAFILAWFKKLTVGITFPMFILLGIQYFNLYSGGTNIFLWFWIFSWVIAVLLVFVAIKKKGD